MSMMSEAINEISAALAKAQGQIEGASKGKINPAFKSKYADLASIWDACREALSTNGLAVLQIPNETPEGMLLTTMVTHSSGQWFRSSYPVRPVQATPQGLGSAITYARRYALMAMVGIAPEDDDGEAAMGRAPQQAANCQPAAQKPPAPAPVDRKAHETIAAAIELAIIASANMKELGAAWVPHKDEIAALPVDLRNALVAAKDARKELLAGEEAA